MTTIAVDRVQTDCPGSPDGVHVWAHFDGGRGCMQCQGWGAFYALPETVDPLPTQFPAFHATDITTASYGATVNEHADDLDLQIANELLPVVRLDVTYIELVEIANQLIHLIRE